MVQQEYIFEDEMPDEFQQIKPRVTFKKISNIAFGIAGAAASVTFGLQFVGPAIASVLHPSAVADAASVPAASSPSSQVVSQVAGGASVGNSKSVNPPIKIALVDPKPGVTGAIAVTGGSATGNPSSSSQLRVPSQDPALTFGNVSSATPSGAVIAKGGSGSSISTHDAYETEGEGESD